jgi:nucleotide-binding universal stress UspA family protein
VVIGLDGSETAWNAFHWGIGEAERLGGRAVAVYVSSPAAAQTAPAWIFAAMLGFTLYDHPTADEAAAEKASKLWEEVKRRAPAVGTPLSFIHARGDTVDALLHIASDLGADVIAVGRSTKARHLLAGSLGRRLMARPGAPIIAIVP